MFVGRARPTALAADGGNGLHRARLLRLQRDRVGGKLVCARLAARRRLGSLAQAAARRRRHALVAGQLAVASHRPFQALRFVGFHQRRHPSQPELTCRELRLARSLAMVLTEGTTLL